MKQETRSLNLVESRLAGSATNQRRFEGYASVWGVIDSYNTTFARGCFQESLERHLSAGSMPLMFANHDTRKFPIGEWLEMEEDDYGLRVVGELHETSDGNDAYYLLKKGKVNGLSIGVWIEEATFHEHGSSPEATFTKVDLFETSVVYMPANEKALITDVRSAVKDGMSIRELEALLRNFLSRSEAVAVASQFESKKELHAIAEQRSIIDAMDKFIRSTK